MLSDESRGSVSRGSGRYCAGKGCWRAWRAESVIETLRLADYAADSL